ncbi:hypothetical protein JTB14_022248 [Gonioctena quinquepunctata]|nr:hypothetical protein JTB14_022248 [Gonioctena quinquepunctata]
MNLSNIQKSPNDSINDSYATAIEDDENETQYLSVLETSNDETLEDLPNTTVGNTEHSETSSESGNINFIESGEQQVVVFKLEGSDDLYGVQIAQDEEGNYQKYQFQFRTREDGELEAIPDTIQLVPNETEDENEIPETGICHSTDVQDEQIFQEAEETKLSNVQSQFIFQKKEVLAEENNGSRDDNQTDNDEIESNENTLLVLIKSESDVQEVEKDDEDLTEDNNSTLEQDDNYSEEETIDVKPGIVELSGTLSVKTPSIIKSEYLNEHGESLRNEGDNHEDIEEIPFGETEVHEETVVADSLEECVSEADSYEPDTQDDDTLVEYQHFDTESGDEVCENTQAYENSPGSQLDPQEGHYANIFIGNDNIEELPCGADIQPHIIAEDGHYVETELQENDSDNEDYEIVEGLPVTAEGDISETSSSPVHHQESLLELKQLPLGNQISQMTTNVLKQPMHSNNMKDFKKKTVLYYMLHTTDQKENVNSLPLVETLVADKPNPRSLLKHNIEVKSQDNIQLLQEKAREREKLLEKRYARSKEAVQAKLFNNFINKTTIAHAPVRQTRLPRKQEIKPVDTRRDEEIIVQEVMVSSTGFIENANERLKNKDKFEVTSIVELSDTDEELNSIGSSKKKKKHKKPNKTLKVGSEDSDASVIEILHSDEESEKQQTQPFKKSCGRPRKCTGDALKRPRGRPPKHDGSSPQKKSRTQSSEIESDQGKIKFDCPHCSKSFPSQNSLSIHIQHHNLENNLRSTSRFPMMEYKYKCDECEEKFKNGILLKRHVCHKKDDKLKCSICLKYFKDISLLNIHKKTHVKQNLVKTTTTVTISPKKFIPRPSTSKFKSPKKAISIYKCHRCSKICPTQASLTIHEKTHKTFPCTNCKADFASKILLDTHVRLTCVKQPSPKNRRLSFKIRKSFVQAPRKVAEKKRSVNLGLNSVSMCRPLDIEVACDSCTKKFNTLTALFKHKVKDHGLHTPDKRVFAEEKKTIHKPLNTHGGIPAPARLNKAFQGLRKKLATLKTNGTPIENPEDKSID